TWLQPADAKTAVITDFRILNSRRDWHSGDWGFDRSVRTAKADLRYLREDFRIVCSFKDDDAADRTGLTSFHLEARHISFVEIENDRFGDMSCFTPVFGIDQKRVSARCHDAQMKLSV